MTELFINTDELIQRIVDNVDAEIQKFLDLQGEEFLSRADEIVERIVGFFSEDIKALIAEEIGPIAVVMGVTGGLMWLVVVALLIRINWKLGKLEKNDELKP